MTVYTVKKAEIRKNWVAPELKKICIEQITASTTFGSHPESSAFGSEHYS
jgi:hypothetical protein